MNKKKVKPLTLTLIVIGAILLALAATIGGLLWYISDPGRTFDQLNEPTATLAPTPTPEATPVPDEPEASEEPVASAEPTPTAEPEMTEPPYEFANSRVNVLVLGADSSVERVAAGLNFRTDTMILLSIDFENKKVDMISIPRDAYVRINGGEKFNKINAAFVFGGGREKQGYEYAINTVENLTGVRIDYYVGFGMNVVKEVVNAMGGVDYDCDIAFTMCGRPTEKGMQHMDGQKVLDYCRFRKGGKGDVDRVDRQQRMLFTIFETMLNTNQIKNIPQIYTAVQKNIDTDLELLQIASLAYFAKDLSMSDLQRHTIPGNGQYVGSRSYYIVNQDKMSDLIKSIFGKKAPFDEAITLEAIEARVAETEGIGTESGEGAESSASDDPMTVQIEAEEMLSFIDDYGDTTLSEVIAVRDRLSSAISSGSVEEMKSAMSAVRKVLPGA